MEDYGVVFDETAEVYTLMEPVVSESTYVTTTLTRAAYDGNNLIAVMEIAVKTGALEEAGIEIIPDLKLFPAAKKNGRHSGQDFRKINMWRI